MDPESQTPPPPSFGSARPPLGRISSWQRVSPVIPGDANTPPPPVPGNQFVGATSPRSSRSSFALEGQSEPRSGMAQISPEMWDAMRRFMEAGGYEGMKKRIVEEVGEQLKNGDSDGDSMGSAPSPSPPPPTFPGHPPSLRPGFQISPQPSGPSLPHTPPASPHHKPAACPAGNKMSPSSVPPPPLARPRQPGREADLSPVDKFWGELFDANGKATKRLGQVLRGLANYLISQACPPDSVVLTPSKLSAFYKRFAVDNEPHPYPSIFECREDDKEDYKDIAHLYEDLECEYHLVKPHPNSRARPIVPALTPAGFVKWAIMSIYAYPDEEAQRLHAIMSLLPINAEIDGRRERLPKQLSRHLLPARPDKTARRNLDEAVEEVLYERGAAKKARRASYGTGGVKARPANRRSESEPLARGDRRPRDDDDEQPKKHVSFGWPRADGSGIAVPRRPSSERPGRPYNLHGGKPPTPAPERPGEEPSSPAAPQFEPSSGRDREREYRDRGREYKYSRDAAPRRMSERRESRSGSRKRRGKREVVVKQDRGSGLWQFLTKVEQMGLLDK